jgi:hypothetical protein
LLRKDMIAEEKQRPISSTREAARTFELHRKDLSAGIKTEDEGCRPYTWPS